MISRDDIFAKITFSPEMEETIIRCYLRDLYSSHKIRMTQLQLVSLKQTTGHFDVPIREAKELLWNKIYGELREKVAALQAEFPDLGIINDGTRARELLEELATMLK